MSHLDSGDFREAARVSTAFSFALERRCLRWLAGRMPARLSSDHLTMLALVAMLMAGLSYACARASPWGLLSASVWLAVNWFGDSLDGTLARVRGHERPRYGFYVDHVVDAFGVLFLLGGLGLSSYMSPVVALAVIAAYFLISIEAHLATYARGRFTMSFGKLGPTEGRIALILGNLALLDHHQVILFGRSHHLFDIGGLVAVGFMVVATAVSASRNTRALYRQEPLPTAPTSLVAPAAASTNAAGIVDRPR